MKIKYNDKMATSERLSIKYFLITKDQLVSEAF